MTNDHDFVQLASHYGGFFNRTVKVLGRLGETFPQYAAITDLPHLSTSKKLRDSVEAVYVDLFEFFSGIAAVFVKKDTRKPTAIHPQAFCLLTRPQV